MTVTNPNVNTPIPPQPTPIATPTPAATPVPVANSVPAISGLSPDTVNVGNAYSFTPNAKDADNDNLTFSITNKPAWATFNTTTGNLSGTPNAADVSSGIVISVTDGKSAAVSLPAFGLAVIQPNRSPTIGGIPSTNVSTGGFYSFTPSTTDADNDILTFSITNKPAWATFDTHTGALTGIPTDSDVGKAADIVITVSDNKGGSASLAPFNLAVVVSVEPVVCPFMVIGEYECRVPSLGAGTTFSLNNAPLGMMIQPRSGYLHWTPSPAQQGQHTVEFVRERGKQNERSTLTFTVPPITAPVLSGIYVAPNGSDTAAGTLAEPLASLQRAANLALPGDIIYLRGGTYRNVGYDTDFATRTSGTLARITRSGAIGQPITIRPYGNEYVKLKSDVGGVSFVNAQYWRMQNIELEGTAESLKLKDSLDLWWDVTIRSAKIDGRGIAMNNAHHIDVVNCLVHSFTGAGTSNNDSSYISITDSVIYNNAWWSTSGVHGMSNGKPSTLDNADTTSFKVIMERNLVYGNQSSIISHVFSKGIVKLEIDEGNGLHMQNTEGDFVGRFLVKNNLVLYNGKSGLGLNNVDHGVIENNAFYANTQGVNGAGELNLQTSISDSIANNLFHALPVRRTIQKFNGDYVGVFSNYAVSSADTLELPSSIVQVTSVFANPSKLDFRPSANVPTGYGVDAAVLAQFDAKSAEFGLTPAPAPTLVNRDFVNDLKRKILKTWPVPVKNGKIPENLIFEDPETGLCYAYADRSNAPDPLNTATVVCP